MDTEINRCNIKHVFYINLDARTDRKQHIETQLRLLGLEATRFSAIKHNIGAIGCALSHLEILRQAKRENYDHVMILEDDILFIQPTLFLKSFHHFITTMRDYDVCMLAGNNIGEYTVIDPYSVKISQCFTTTGYLVKQHYYDRLIDNIEKGIQLYLQNPSKGKIFAIDVYWKSLQTRDRWYLLTPLSVIQKPDYSDIAQKQVNYSSLMLQLDNSLIKTRNMFAMPIPR